MNIPKEEAIWTNLSAKIDFLELWSDKKKSRFCILISKYKAMRKFETSKHSEVDTRTKISSESSLKKIDLELNIYIYSI